MNLNNQVNDKYPSADRILTKRKFGAVDSTRGENTMNPPIELEDYYNWMRDDERKNEKVLNHLKLENSYTEHVMKSMQPNIDELYQELLSHVQETYDSYPLPNSDNGWESEYYYFVRTVEGKFSYSCRINTQTKEITELLDENKIADGKTCCDISSFEVTKDHKYMSYGIDLTGDEKYDLKIINIDTQEELSHDYHS